MDGRTKIISLKNLISYLILILTFNVSSANEYQKGDVIILPLTESESQEDFFYKNSKITKIIKNDKKYLLFGIPYDINKGENTLVLESNKANKMIRFKIIDKVFDIQHINFKQGKYQKKSKKDLERIISEKNKILEARRIKYDKFPDYNFIIPAEGIVTGVYGTRRYYNGIEGKYHNGHDIAADTGTSIVAASSGKVILAGDFYYNGKFVMINHGNNLVSVYLHMHDIAVNTGDMVTKGQQIGTIGNTGRSTGPHLHWSVILNNSYINPLSLVRD